MREQNDPPELPDPPPSGPGLPGHRAVPPRPCDAQENRPNSGVPDERTRDDPADKVLPRPPKSGDVSELT